MIRDLRAARRPNLPAGRLWLTAALAGMSIAAYPAWSSAQGNAKPAAAAAQTSQSPVVLRVVARPRRNRGTDASRSAGQRVAAPGSTSPFGGVRGGSGTTFSFDFHGADITNVLKFYAQVSGLTITTDQALTGPVTIINPTPVSLDDAFKILQSVLAVRGFTAQKDGTVLSIEPMDRAIGSATLVNPTGDPGAVGRMNPMNEVMTQVIPLENVDAETLAKDLQPLVNKGASLVGSAGTNSLILTDTASNVERFLELVHALDKTSGTSEIRLYPLKNAEAMATADLINQIYKGPNPAQGNPQQPRMQMPPGMQPQAAPSHSTVTAVADQRTNSVMVVAPPAIQDQIKTSIIDKLDGEEVNTLTTQIRKLKFADAIKTADMVNTVLSNQHGAAPGQSPNAGFQQRAFGPFRFFGNQNQNQPEQQQVESSDPFGKVVADPRTNSLIITASVDRLVQINQLIDELDVDVPVESTTFVFPLKNAQADDVAYALGQAFNTYQSNNNSNPFGFFFGGGGASTNTSSINGHTPINRRLGQDQSRAPVRASGGPLTDSTGMVVPQGVPGVMTSSGFVPSGQQQSQATPPADTQAGARQPRQFGFGRGFGAQSGISQTNGPQYGRGRTGTYANLLQLQGNVFVTPSPGGDSIIVTTTPDNYNAVKAIIDQLDVTPRQVMIEAIVAEVTLTKDQKLGWSITGNLFHLFGSHSNGQGQLGLTPPGTPSSTTLDPTATGIQFVLSGTNYTSLINALESDTAVKVISTPRVFTSNNQAAEIDVTTNVPYITGQLNGTFSNTVASQVEYKQIGLILHVTPRITREGLVTIDVNQDASDLLSYVTLGTGTNAIQAPEFNDRYTDTSVTVKDGQTLIIGGLIRNRDEVDITKVPILSDIPIIGQFFRGREHKKDRVELLIFLTPHVVTGMDEAGALTGTEATRMSTNLPGLLKADQSITPPAGLPSAPQPPKQQQPAKPPKQR